MLFPVPKPGLFLLYLLRESLPQLLLFFLEFGVVELLHLGFTKLAGFHLLLAVVLVMQLLRSRDEVKHMGADQKRAELLEVAMVLVLNWT